MITPVDNPGHRVSLLAALVHRLDRGSAIGLGFGRDGRAAVIADEAVAHLAASGNVEDRVGGAVLAVVSDGVGAALAAAELTSGENGNSADHLGAGAGESKGHGAAVAEASREAEARFYAEVGFDGLDELVEEGDVLAALVAPAGVEAVGHDKDGRVVGNGVKSIVGQGAAAVGVLAVGNLLGAAAELMPGEDKTVGVLLVVAVRELDDVLA